jgi:hypothetical protein
MYFLASISFATEVRIAMRRLLRLLRCRDTRSLCQLREVQNLKR